jgi:hypothetical protein
MSNFSSHGADVKAFTTKDTKNGIWFIKLQHPQPVKHKGVRLDTAAIGSEDRTPDEFRCSPR